MNPNKTVVELLTKDKLTKKNLIFLEHTFFTDSVEAGVTCCKCNRSNNLTLDHIIPKSILVDFGIDVERTYDEENLLIMCRACNQIKANHLDFSIPMTKYLLEKYMLIV